MRLCLVLAALVLSGCATDRALSRVAERSAPPSDRTFDLPAGYDVLDIEYATALVALDDDPDPWDVRERTTVQVFALHRATGAETLFVYDLALDGASPTAVVRFRRVPEGPPSQPAGN
ncbi:MAG: hypothetical protein WBA11_04980 [Rubrivirga sp.]